MKNEGLSQIATVALLLAWLGFLAFLINGALHDASDARWARYLAIQSSLEAVVFAAAGALFGTKVQQGRVADAKDQASKAQGRAAEAEQHARAGIAEAAEAKGKGRALAAAVEAEAGVATAKSRGLAEGDGGLAALAVTARRLFPD